MSLYVIQLHFWRESGLKGRFSGKAVCKNIWKNLLRKGEKPERRERQSAEANQKAAFKKRGGFWDRKGGGRGFLIETTSGDRGPKKKRIQLN